MIALQNQLVEAAPKMRIKVLALLIVLAFLPLAGCKKDAEAKTILTEFDSFTNELVKRVDAASNPADGVDDAQVGDETKKMMESSLVEDAKKVANLQVKYMGTSMRDAAFKAKLDKLTRDYQSLFKM
jgi:uncharacterized Zn finger protein